MKRTNIHPFDPVYDKDSKVLILGSFPSPKSRELGFYYGHPQNRFWKVLATVFKEQIPETIEQKKAFVLKYHIALWDVVKRCKIKGASDSSIIDVKANNIAWLIKNTKIDRIITTGKKADQLYQKYCFPKTKIPSLCLPSTSPANCAFKENELVRAYELLKNIVK